MIIQQVEPNVNNSAATLNLASGSPSRNSQTVSNNQDREEQMQTATEPNNVFSAPSSLGHSSEHQSSSSNPQPPLASLRVGEIVTDDEDLPQVAPLQRESSSEGVRFVFRIREVFLETQLHPLVLPIKWYVKGLF